jgi:hypothetical protein
MPLNALASTTANIYAMSDALSLTQTFDILWIAIVMGIVGILLVEERTLVFLARTPGRMRRERRARLRRAVQ